MKPRVYLLLVLALVPFQSALFRHLPAGPDLALAVVYAIGLLTGPAEGAVVGMGAGLLQDIGSDGLLGVLGITRGVIGLLAGVLGRRVIAVDSPALSLLLSFCGLLEGLVCTLFLQTSAGSLPLGDITLERLLPRAVLTGLVGWGLLAIVARRRVRTALMRPSLLRE